MGYKSEFDPPASTTRETLMKLLSFAADGGAHVGAVVPEGILDLTAALNAINLVAHDGDIELPPFPQKVDEEHELALVVGRDCRHIRPHQAADYIFGYTICNDVSARDRQRERLNMGQPYSYAKNFATFCPM